MKTKKSKRWKKITSMGTTIVCPYCLKPITDPSQLTIEHEPPRSRQAELGIISKTIYACKRCNNQKGSLTASEYAEWLKLEAIRNGVKQR